MEKYDIVIVGAGCAGLSLTYRLLNSTFKNSKILLIEPMSEIPNKTWCYWAPNPLPIHPINRIHKWDQLSIETDSKRITKDLGSLVYFHLSSFDFYDAMSNLISKHSNVSILRDKAIEVFQKKESAFIKTTKNHEIQADLVFDSRLPEELCGKSTLKQIFLGWKIKVDKSTFDPKKITLMDIIPSDSLFEFFYVLPFSETEALIEFTTYATTKLSEDYLENKIQSYLQSKFTIDSYQINYRENGVIPMSTRIGSKNTSENIIPIGTGAGWIKASTGYGFWNIQKNCDLIVNKMERNESLQSISLTKKRFKFYDNILLNIAHKWPKKLESVFIDLFQTSSAEDVLKFLSEETKFSKELTLLSKLKFPIFVKSLLSYEKR